MIAVALATEDRLSEAVGIRLLKEASSLFYADPLLRRDGAGYLKSRMKNWREIATLRPVVILTDLDRTTCAPSLISSWLGSSPAPPNLLLRVAVREIESWLIADHEGFGKLLGSSKRLSPDPDALPDPKRALLALARTARRDVRDELVAPEGAIASQGLGYNARLSAFVEEGWSPTRAAKRSQSLRCARLRLAELAKRLSG